MKKKTEPFKIVNKVMANSLKYSKLTKSNDMVKIIKMIAREEEFERNGGGQWVANNKAHKNNKKYNRRNFKNETKSILNN